MTVIDKLRTALRRPAGAAEQHQPFIGWTIAQDGRFLIARATKSSERHSIKVIPNWSSTLSDAGNH